MTNDKFKEKSIAVLKQICDLDKTQFKLTFDFKSKEFLINYESDKGNLYFRLFNGGSIEINDLEVLQLEQTEFQELCNFVQNKMNKQLENRINLFYNGLLNPDDSNKQLLTEETK